MRFDWQNFVVINRIRYDTKSSNVARGHIAVKCPFCGPADPSAHMGLSLDIRKPSWGCWRNRKHSGRNPVWLIVKLLGCSLARASEIVGVESRAYADDLQREVAKLSPVPNAGMKDHKCFQPLKVQSKAWEFNVGDKLRTAGDDEILRRGETLYFPQNIKPIDGKGYSGAFLDYLYSREFDDPYRAVELAGLRYSVTGSMKNRIVFPVNIGGSMVTYTGRDITGKADLRYRSLSADDEILNIKHCLYFEDAVARGGNILFLTEGPIDALKLNCYLAPGYLATSFFGMPEAIQVIKLLCYAPAWRAMVVWLDRDATTQRMQLASALRGADTELKFVALPQGVDDPGGLTSRQVRNISASF